MSLALWLTVSTDGIVITVYWEEGRRASIEIFRGDIGRNRLSETASRNPREGSPGNNCTGGSCFGYTLVLM